MVYLPEPVHQGLRKLAVEPNISVAELIRRAVDILYGEDIGDIQDMEEELAKFRADPESAANLKSYLQQSRFIDSRRKTD